MKKNLFFISITICLSVLFASCSGGGIYKNESNPEEIGKAGYSGSDIWTAVPLVSQRILDSGYTGGEGGQQPLSITFNSVDDSIVYLGTGTGGLYRSEDAGKTWAPSNIGIASAGATGIACDPMNVNRILMVGTNSYAHYKNGLYLSTDGGKTWSAVNNQAVIGGGDMRRQIAYDISSYDGTLGYCRVVYWSREDVTSNKENDPMIYKSEDGGVTWRALAGSAEYAGGDIAVDSSGRVFAAKSSGVFMSEDAGGSFINISRENAHNMVIVRDNIYVLTDGGVCVSTDFGLTFDNVTVSGFPKYPYHLAVSAINPQYMLIQDDSVAAGVGGGDCACYYSRDGGATWDRSESDYSDSFLPTESVSCVYSFSPYDENIVVASGGNTVMRSRDGGATYKVSAAGYNSFSCAGKFVWNQNYPGLTFLGSSEYGGAYTADSGKTWKYMEWLGAGSICSAYAGYALTDKTVFAAVSDSRSKYGSYYLYITFDGGNSFVNTGNKIKGSMIGAGIKGNDLIAFMGEWRTSDGGLSWSEMDGCTGVYACDEKGTLYGVNEYYIVRSFDHGLTWDQIGTVGSKPSDMAYSSVTQKLYVIGDGTLYTFVPGQKKLSTLYYGSARAVSVCVDPDNQSVFYIGCKNNSSYYTSSVIISVDCGKTWSNLSRTEGDGRSDPDGGRQAGCVRVLPGTGELFVSCEYNGLWKFVDSRV